MNVLILGGAGFVGRHYTEYFLKKKANVEIIDNIAPLSGGVHPKRWKFFDPYKFNRLFHWSKSILRLVPLYSNRFSLDIPSNKSN